MISLKPKVLFIYELSPELHAQDGLHAALDILRGEFDIDKVNLKINTPNVDGYDFVLGHGAWGSKVDNFIRSNDLISNSGLCIAGNINPPEEMFSYSVLFYETDWYKKTIEDHPNIIKAFGINSKIFFPSKSIKLFDYLGVGSFAKWKRWEKMCSKKGIKLIVGEIQKDNLVESLGIMGCLVASGVGVMPNVEPHTLAKLYNASKTVYLPATDYGGSERAVWEAKACGCKVEIEPDNLKLKELLDSDFEDEYHYAQQLSIGINKFL